MRKTRKRSLSAAVIAFALSFGLAFSPLALNVKTAGAATQGFTNSAVAVSATNEALSGWQYYFYDPTHKKSTPKNGGFYYESDKMFLKAVADGHTGNGMLMERNEGTDEFVAYSYRFDVKANQTYKISAWVKTDCADNAKNKLTACIEKHTDSNFTAIGSVKEWTEYSFYHTTGASETSMVICLRAEGIGKFYIDDITVKESTAIAKSAPFFSLLTIGNLDNGAADGWGRAGMATLTAANLSTDSSDGDGSSLELKDQDVLKAVFGKLVGGKRYNVSFKYKFLEAGRLDSKLQIRMDGYYTDGTDLYWLDAPRGEQNVWTSFSQDFDVTGAAGTKTINYLNLIARGHFLVDEFYITCLDEADPMQYLPGGTFSGVYTAGYPVIGASSNFAKQKDGSYVYVAGNHSIGPDSGSRSYIDIDITHLEKGKTYTLSFEYRSGAGEGLVQLGNDWKNHVALLGGFGYSAEAWTSKTVDFEAGKTMADGREAEHIEINGDSNGGTFDDAGALTGQSYPLYIRNIQITDSDGNTYVANQSFAASSTEVLGENVFVYGEFNGNIQNEWTGWTFENGGIYGLKFQDNNTDWKLNLFGTAEAAATAISDEIAVTANAIVVEQEFFQGEAKVTLIVGEKEIEATDDGVFVLPEGTTAVKIKYSASEYVAIKKIFIGSHVHGDDCANVPVSNSEAIYEWSEDNKTCTATMLYICGAKSTVTETATAVITDNTATLYEKGTGLYTVTFEDNRFATQSKTAETEVRSPENVTLSVGETENGSVKLTVGDTAITEFPYTIMEKTEVTVTATAERGYKLVAITVNGVAIEGNTFTVDGAAVVSATFEKDPLFRSITAATAENGTVTVDVANAYDGETVTVTATAAEGYELDYITVNGETIEGNTFTVAGDATVSAVFKKLPEREVMEGCSSSAGFNGGFALILVAVALAFVLKAKRA